MAENDMTIGLLECGHAESPHADFTRGYGMDDNGNRYCYECCAERDKEQMRTDGRISLYLSYDEVEYRPGSNMMQVRADGKFVEYFITNWPGSLKFGPVRVRKGHHNIAGTRYDTWFTFEGYTWHGVSYGEWTQIIHCKRTKERA